MKVALQPERTFGQALAELVHRRRKLLNRRLEEKRVRVILFLVARVGISGQRGETEERGHIASIGRVVVVRARLDDERFAGGVVQAKRVGRGELGPAEIEEISDDARIALDRFLARGGRGVEIDLVERHSRNLGRAGRIALRGGEAVAIVNLFGGSGHGRGHDLGRAEQTHQRSARKLGGWTIVEPPAVPLERLPFGLLANLGPIDFGAVALLLRELEAFGPDRVNKREIVADSEILEVLRLLLPPARKRERPHHAANPLAEFDKGLSGPLQLRPDNFGEEGIATVIRIPEALDCGLAEGGREHHHRAGRHVLRRQQSTAGGDSALDLPLVPRRADDRTARIQKKNGDLWLLVGDCVHDVGD